MRLPNVEEALVERTKITGYLLSDTNRRGHGKARFFTGFGFSPASPEALRQALLQHANANEVTSLHESEHGTKYTVEGPLPSPDGRAPVIRSVWIIDTGRRRPRFVTAFPGRR